MMNNGVPLGVRIYDIKDGVDRHVTKWVDDFSFRHTAPGGCASAAIRFRVPKDKNVDPLMFGNLYYRVQIYDGRSAEVLWEGRVEDPATQIAEDAWELGILGGQKATTDISMPTLYVDNTVENWVFWEDLGIFESSVVQGQQIITGKMKPNYEWHTGTLPNYLSYDSFKVAGGIARVSSTVKSDTLGAQGANFEMIMYLDSHLTPIDVTPMNVGDTYKTNVIGTDFTYAGRSLGFKLRRKAGSANYTITATDDTEFRLKWPKVIGLRMDELGNTLISPSDYPVGDFVYVHQVVRDVLGKYFGGAWWAAFRNDWDVIAGTSKPRFNKPAPGSIRGHDAFIDMSDEHKITNLWWSTKVDAKTILDTLMLVQRNAYWAVWPSDHRFEQGEANADIPEYQFRFAWAKWPISWNYLASSEDGMSQQLNGDELYNAGTMDYQEGRSGIIDATTNMEYSEAGFEYSGSGKFDWEVEELAGRFTRMTHFTYPNNPATEDISSGIGEDVIREAFSAQQEPVNVGTMVVKRPIYCVDDGSSNGDGFAGMLQPWELRPGRLIKIKDIDPLGNASQMQWDSGFGRVLNSNTGFELGNTTGWALNFGTFTAATDRVFSGTRSGKVVPTGASVNAFVNCAVQPVSPRSLYRASAWVQTDVARSVSLEIHWYTAASALITTSPLAYSMPADQWRFLEVVGEAPVNAAFGALLLGMSSTPPASNIMWFDEGKFEHLLGFPEGHENSIFRVAATEYSTSDNSCKLELDELPRWSLSTQVIQSGAPGNLRVLGRNA